MNGSHFCNAASGFVRYLRLKSVGGILFVIPVDEAIVVREESE